MRCVTTVLARPGDAGRAMQGSRTVRGLRRRPCARLGRQDAGLAATTTRTRIAEARSRHPCVPTVDRAAQPGRALALVVAHGSGTDPLTRRRSLSARSPSALAPDRSSKSFRCPRPHRRGFVQLIPPGRSRELDPCALLEPLARLPSGSFHCQHRSDEPTFDGTACEPTGAPVRRFAVRPAPRPCRRPESRAHRHVPQNPSPHHARKSSAQ